MPLIGIVDYGMGNLRSVEKGFSKVGLESRICSSPDGISSYDGLVVPGVGAFGDAMEHLRSRGLSEAVLEYQAGGRPVLGICLGMQIFLETSEEHGFHEGLGMIQGSVVRLPDTVKVPHMGWNVVRFARDVPLFRGIEDGSRFYFVHSYYCAPADPSVEVGLTPYGLDFTSALGKDNVWGLQFHPEKSSLLGLRILENFGRMVSGS